MKVAVVVRSLKIGGMERVAVNLSEAFADAGHDSHLIYFKPKGRVFTPKSSVKLHLFNLDKMLKLTVVGLFLNIFAKFINGIIRGSFFYLNGLLLTPFFKYKLKKLEKDKKFDLIVMRGHGTFELIWPYKDDRVIQMVESVFVRDSSKLDKFYIKCVYAGKHLGCVSSGVEQKVQEVLTNTKVKANSVNVFYNPVDFEVIEKNSLAYKVDITEDYILSVGRVTPNKNLSFLLQSYAYAKENFGLKLPLVIVGNGHDMQNVKQKVKELNLENNVKFMGLLENPYPWIKQAKLVTSTSKAEGFGMVILEALVCHTKVLTTKSKGGMKDIMVDELQNYMVDFDYKLFAKRMVEVLNEKEEIDFDKYTQKFSKQNVVRSFIERGDNV